LAVPDTESRAETITAGTRVAGVAAAAALHVLAGAALLSHAPTRSALLAAAPIMVDLITPPKVEPRAEPPVEIAPAKPRPKPKPVAKALPKPPHEPLRVVTAPIETPSPVVVTPPPEPPTPPPPIALAPPEPVAAAAPAPVAAVTPPIFNADYLDNPAPSYPSLSRRTKEQGRVILRVRVTPAGTAQEIQVHASSGHSRLDDAAREAVLHWKFVPAKRGEEPVSAWVLIPVSFRLDG
jgi:periplasmic protein TonB